MCEYLCVLILERPLPNLNERMNCRCSLGWQQDDTLERGRECWCSCGLWLYLSGLWKTRFTTYFLLGESREEKEESFCVFWSGCKQLNLSAELLFSLTTIWGDGGVIIAFVWDFEIAINYWFLAGSNKTHCVLRCCKNNGIAVIWFPTKVMEMPQLNQ